jgi:hypothetical protein
MQQPPDDPLAPLRKLYPNLSEEQLMEAKENLKAYLLLAWEIFDSDGEEKDEKAKDET